MFASTPLVPSDAPQPANVTVRDKTKESFREAAINWIKVKAALAGFDDAEMESLLRCFKRGDLDPSLSKTLSKPIDVDAILQ